MLINQVIPYFFYKQSQTLCFQKLILAKWMLCWNYFLIRVTLWGAKLTFACCQLDQFLDGIIWYTCLHAMVTVNICEKFCWKMIIDRLAALNFWKVFPAFFNRNVMLLLLHGNTFSYLFYSHSNAVMKVLVFMKWQLFSHINFFLLPFWYKR